VLKSDGTVERKPVELGGRHNNLRVVRGGVTAQDRVVIKGIQTLRPDVKVTPHEGSIEDTTGAPAQDNKISLPTTPASG
jgi:hypothetical protein